MTFEISLPLLVGFICFAVPASIGGYASFRIKDWFPAVIGIALGIILAILGFGVSSDYKHNKIKAEHQAEQREIQETHLATMPEDWQNLHKLLQKTKTVPLRQAYVVKFLKGKDESKPEISAEAFGAFCSIHGEWLRMLIPYTIIDVNAAMGELK